MFLLSIYQFLLAVLFHFAYDVFPNPLFAILFPINESVFQHLKLFTYPILVTYLIFKNKRLSLSQTTLTIYISQFLTLSIFYILKCGFSFESTFFDILLTFLSLYIANIISYYFFHNISINYYLCLILICLNIFILGIYTIYPLNYPIFALLFHFYHNHNFIISFLSF